MARRNNKRSANPRQIMTPPNGGSHVGSVADQPLAYLIRIHRQEDRERAIAAFLRVPRTRCRFPDNQFLVTGDHIAALNQAGIPFEDITETK